MRHVRFIGATVLSLVFVAPAIAASNMHGQLHGPIIHRMHAQDLDHFDLGIARPTYHSGWVESFAGFSCRSFGPGRHVWE
jgi:hypothetical protein